MEQESSKKNNIIVLCVVIAVIAVALVAYIVISGQKGDGSPTVSATMELNTVNIYGAWYKKAGDSTYELRFKDNKELSYKQTAADGTVTAQSDEGTYDIADGKLILTIVAGGQTYSDTCIANVNEKQMSLVTEANGSGLFDGIYDKAPKKFPDAVKYDVITHHDILVNKLQVMDSAAAAICTENNIPIIVFDLNRPDNIYDAVMGETVGTLVTKHKPQ